MKDKESRQVFINVAHRSASRQPMMRLYGTVQLHARPDVYEVRTPGGRYSMRSVEVLRRLRFLPETLEPRHAALFVHYLGDLIPHWILYGNFFIITGEDCSEGDQP